MKKLTGFIMAMVLVFVLVSCSNSNNKSAEKEYSFSGEIEEMQVQGGKAIIGSKDEIFNGGKLKIKGEGFDDLIKYTMTFYITNGEERWTILSNKVQHSDDTLEIKELEIGEITGQVLNTNMDESELRDHLYFELITTDKSGETKTYTVHMEVKEITAVK